MKVWRSTRYSERRDEKVFDYSKLRGRIVEKYGTIEAFAEGVGKSYVTISKKLNNKTGISREDIIEWSNLLDIPSSDYDIYFFVREV